KTGMEVSKYPISTQGVARPVPFKMTGVRALDPDSAKTGGIGKRGAFRGIGMFPGETEGIASVAFSPDGKLVLAGCMDNVLRVFELSTGKERRLEGHTQQLHGAVFTPDGRRILSGSYDQTVRLWEVATGQEVCRFLGHTNWVWGVAISPDGQLAL